MFIQFPQAIVCRVTGKDALRYLQNRLSNEVKALGVGTSCTAAALSPQGKIEGVFLVLAVAAGEYLLIADGGPKAEVLGALRRFQVAERIEFHDESDAVTVLHCDGLSDDDARAVFALQELPAVPGHFISANGIIAARIPRFSAGGLQVIAPKAAVAGVIEKLAAKTSELTGDALTIERIRKNVPAFPEELNDKLLISESGLPEIISFTKGCYVGQEVVAKIDALGKAPRVLVRFRAAIGADSLRGVSIYIRGNEARAIGSVLTAVRDQAAQEEIGFAALKNDPAIVSGELTAAGRALTLL